jgi:polyisoprenoid-binding protein YceI
MKRIVLASLAALVCTTAGAAPVTYVLDPNHTYPSFAADHMGISTWRGKFTENSGKVVLDKDAKSGTIEITVNIASVDFGNAKMDERAKAPDIFDAAKFPTATYAGKFTQWSANGPTEAQGTFTFHGVSKPLTLKIESFKCVPNPRTQKEVCGANATATFSRSDYGIDYGDKYGFLMGVKLDIQVEGSPEGWAPGYRQRHFAFPAPREPLRGPHLGARVVKSRAARRAPSRLRRSGSTRVPDVGAA